MSYVQDFCHHTFLSSTVDAKSLTLSFDIFVNSSFISNFSNYFVKLLTLIH